MKYQFSIAGKNYDVDLQSVGSTLARVMVNGESYDISIISKDKPRAVAPNPETRPHAESTLPVSEPKPVLKPVTKPKASGGKGEVVSPLPGVVVDVKVSVGDLVSVGDTVAIVETMKMENNIEAHVSGNVSGIYIEKGQKVKTGDVLVDIS